VSIDSGGYMEVQPAAANLIYVKQREG
jgi:hypothetical protein